ncbi:peptide-N4-(N-acetyl-beta-glucosaminyl) asparagine amidase A [Fagus crenata]
MKSMQLKELNSGGYEVILVTSGAVGLGRQRLRYRRVANSSRLKRKKILTIDGKFIGSEAPFPIFFTGGVNPLFWEPVVSIGAFNLPSHDFDLTPFLGMLVNKKAHRIGFGVSEGISYWLVVDPPIKRKEDFKLLDGSFKVEAERKAVFVGWVKSSLGIFTTVFSQNYKLKNSLSFQNNGAYKLVKKKIKATREVKVLNDLGAVISRVGVRRRYPFVVITSTLPGPKKKKKNTYLLVTNVSHVLNEKYMQGKFVSVVYNVQDSEGWMLVKDHSVLSGAATTRQSFSYRDDFRCYSRTVKASDGKLISDNTTPACFSSV